MITSLLVLGVTGLLATGVIVWLYVSMGQATLEDGRTVIADPWLTDADERDDPAPVLAAIASLKPSPDHHHHPVVTLPPSAKRAALRRVR